MLPTPVLSVSGKGFARLRISAWHFSPAPPILYAVRAIVYHKSRVLSRVLRDFSGSEAPGTPGAEPQRHWLDLPLWHPAGACFVCRLPTLPLPSFLPPIPPPPSPPGKGEIFSLFRRGLRPRHPCIRPFAALAVPAAVAPCGGLPCLPPAAPCLYLLFCPLSPRPLPRWGRGSFKVILCKGLCPLHPRG